MAKGERVGFGMPHANNLPQSSPAEIAQRKAVLDSYDYDAGGLRTPTTHDLQRQAKLNALTAKFKLQNEMEYNPLTEDPSEREARYAKYGAPTTPGYSDEQQQWFVNNPGKKFKDLQAWAAANPEEAAEQGLASNSSTKPKSTARAENAEIAALRAENEQLRELVSHKQSGTEMVDALGKAGVSKDQISKATDYVQSLSPEARVEAAHAIDENLKEAKNPHLREMAGNGERIAVLQNKVLDGSITPKEEAQMDALIARSEKSMILAMQDPAALKEFADIARNSDNPSIKKAIASLGGKDEKVAKPTPEKGILGKIGDFVMHPIDTIKDIVGLGEKEPANAAKNEPIAPAKETASHEPPKSDLVQKAEALRDLGRLLERPDIKESIASAVQFNDKQTIAQNGHQEHTGASLGGLHGGAGLKGQSEARSV